MSSPRGRARRGASGARGRIGAAVAGALLASVTLAGPAFAQAEDPTAPADPPTEAEAPPNPIPTGPPRLDLVSQTPFVAPTDVLRVGLDVVGPEGAELTFTLRSSVLTGDNGDIQARFDAWVDGTADRGAGPFNEPTTVPAANLPPGDRAGRVTAAFDVVPGNAERPLVGFQIDDPGVYPLTIDLHAAGGGPVLDTITTFLVRLPPTSETAPPLTVASVADLHAPVSLRPDRTRTLDPGALERIGLLVDALAAHPGVALTLNPTPETLEALLVTTSAATTSGPSVLDRLRDALAERAVLGSTYVRVDVAAWTRSGMGDVLAYQLSHGVNVTEAVLRDGVPVDQRAWIAEPGLTPEGLGELHALGIDELVVDESVVGPVDARAFPDTARAHLASTQPFDVRTADGTLVRTVASDTTFAERLRVTDDADLNAQLLIADLAVTYFGMTGSPTDVPEVRRGVTFTVPDDDLALQSLRPFLGSLATTPPAGGGGVAIFDPATVPELFTLTPSIVDGATEVRSFTPEPVPGSSEDMGTYPDQLGAAEFDLSAYESMVVGTEPARVLPLRQLLDVSGAADLDDGERTAYLDAVTTTIDAELAGIRVPEQDPITLTSTEYELSVFVENDLSYPVAARLELTSTKLDFPDGDDLEVRLDPGLNRIPIRVETVSGGTFPVDLALRTPDSRIDLGEEVIQIRSTAVSGWGLALSIGAGFFLLVWWTRNWRSTRRSTGEAPPSADVEHGSDDAPPRFTVGSLVDLADGEGSPPPSAGQPAQDPDPVTRG